MKSWEERSITSQPWAGRAHLVFVAKLMLAAAALSFLGRALFAADWTVAGASLRTAGFSSLLVLVPTAVGLLFEAAAWGLLYARLRHSVRLLGLFRVRVATEAISVALPAGDLLAEATAPYLLARHVSPASTLATSAARRWLILRSHGAYVLLAAGLGAALLHRLGLLAVVFASGAALVVASFVVERGASRFGIARRLHRTLSALRRSRVFAWFSPWFSRRPNRSEGALDPRRDDGASFSRVDLEVAELSRGWHVGATVLVLGQWLLEAASSWLILRTLGSHVAFHDVLAVDAALSVLRGVAAVIPAGLGVQDLGYLALFAAIGLAGVGPAFLIVKRGKELVYVAIGVVVLTLLRSRRRSHSRPPEGDDDFLLEETPA